MNESMNQSINHSINQSINQSAEQPISQSINLSKLPADTDESQLPLVGRLEGTVLFCLTKELQVLALFQERFQGGVQGVVIFLHKLTRLITDGTGEMADEKALILTQIAMLL